MSFLVIALGTSGGPRESNLTSFLLGPADGSYFISLDCGSLLAPMTRALKKRALSFSESPIADELALLNRIRAYLITHPHLDHLAALIINSQIDTKKPILALPFTIQAISSHLFNNIIWPNFSNEGENAKNLYSYVRLKEYEKSVIENTEMKVEPFALMHSSHTPSSAFLIEKKQEFVLFCGDSVADSVSKQPLLAKLWEKCAPLIREKRLKAIFLECSYLDSGHEHHLTAPLFLEELSHLKKIANCDLEGLNIVVIHRKEEYEKRNEKPKLIEKELKRKNPTRARLLFPKQGESFLL